MRLAHDASALRSRLQFTALISLPCSPQTLSICSLPYPPLGSETNTTCMYVGVTTYSCRDAHCMHVTSTIGMDATTRKLGFTTHSTTCRGGNGAAGGQMATDAQWKRDQGQGTQSWGQKEHGMTLRA